MRILQNVSLNFGAKPVLKNIDMNLADEGVTCLLGASGCGKSTALRIAAGLLAPDAGQIGLQPGSCGVVFQDARLLPWLTVQENLTLAASDPEKINRVLRDVGLNPDETLMLHPRELSGGMAQRVGIARALLRGSACLMLDEPFAALDAMARSDLQDLLFKLVQKRKKPALFVTHDMDEAFKIASRLLIMNNGRINFQVDRSEFTGREAHFKEKILEIMGKT